MSNSKGRDWTRVLRTSMVGIVGLIVVLACVGAACQWIPLRRDRRLNLISGRLVDVGCHPMHVVCTAEGSLTVVQSTL